jgi:hypothetical protein
MCGRIVSIGVVYCGNCFARCSRFDVNVVGIVIIVVVAVIVGVVVVTLVWCEMALSIHVARGWLLGSVCILERLQSILDCSRR